MWGLDVFGEFRSFSLRFSFGIVEGFGIGLGFFSRCGKG